MPKFGDIGTEAAPVGERKVMWIANGDILILSSTILDDHEDFAPGKITYEVATTTWDAPEMPENR